MLLDFSVVKMQSVAMKRSLVSHHGPTRSQTRHRDLGAVIGYGSDHGGFKECLDYARRATNLFALAGMYMPQGKLLASHLAYMITLVRGRTCQKQYYELCMHLSALTLIPSA